MEKQINKIEIKTEQFCIIPDTEYEYAVKISDLIEWLEKAVKLGATHLDLCANSDYDGGCDDVDFDAVKYEPETDEEFKARELKLMQKYQEIKENKELNERVEYVRLKKKFEN